MILNWFNAREATEVGTALADQFTPQIASGSATQGKIGVQRDHGAALQNILEQADRKVRTLRLNVYKKAKFANSFKWRLLENGVEKEVADHATQRLVMHLSVSPASLSVGHNSGVAPNSPKCLLAQANKCMAQGEYDKAAAFYQDLISLKPDHAVALNNLGSALSKLGRYKDSEQQFRQAISIVPDYPDAHNNLGILLRWRGQIADSEISLRRALKLKPTYTDARYNLGFTLILLGRLRDAKARFEKVLKVAPRHAEALFGMGQVARIGTCQWA